MVEGKYDSLSLRDTGDHLGKIQAWEMMLAITGDIVDIISLDLQTNIASSSHYIMEAGQEISRGEMHSDLFFSEGCNA